MVKRDAPARFREVRLLQPCRARSHAPADAAPAAIRAHRAQSVDVAVRLGVDPRKPGQSIRGNVQLPYGTGKSVRVAVFARGDKADAAREAGADVVGAEDLVEQVQAGNLSFDVAIASPDVMPLVGRVARVLGPRGLMPNPKMGTVTPNVAEAVRASRMGQVSFRVDRGGVVHSSIGKVDFPVEHLAGNLRELLVSLNQARPEGLKGVYLRDCTVSSTMGPGYRLRRATADPSKPRLFMQSEPVPEDVAGQVEEADQQREQRVAQWQEKRAQRPAQPNRYAHRRKQE